MKRIFAIGFIIIYLFANTELHQFLRLPVLIAHLKEHRKQAPHLSLIDFIELHYFSGSPKDADHEKLPFKNNDCLSSPSFIAVLTAVSLERFILSLDAISVTSIYKSPLNPASFHYSIWQPPRA